MQSGAHFFRAEALLRAACNAKTAEDRQRLRTAAVLCLRDADLIEGSKKAIAESRKLIGEVDDLLARPWALADRKARAARISRPTC